MAAKGVRVYPKKGKQVSIVDKDKLYNFIFCKRCGIRTQHIYCSSQKEKQHQQMVYACMKCETEAS